MTEPWLAQWPRERLRIILGPAPCKDCRRLVIYSRRIDEPGVADRWRNRNGSIHKCREPA